MLPETRATKTAFGFVPDACQSRVVHDGSKGVTIRQWAAAVVCVVSGCDDASSPVGAGSDVVTATELGSDAGTSEDLLDTDDSVASETRADDVAEVRDVVLGDPDVLVGSFQVRLVAPAGDTPGSTSVLGKVFDGPTPDPVSYVDAALATDDVDCALLLPVVPFCATACVGGAVCVADDVCQDYPETMNVGRVTVTGLGTTFTMDAIAGTYQPLGPSLPYPAFAAGDPIAIQTSGGDYAPFAITSVGVAPLALTSPDLIVAREQALTLTWDAGSAATRIRVKLDVSHHGGSNGKIQCDTADDGSLTISAALVTALVDLGIAGHPTIVVAREATGMTVTEPGRVELVVGSELEVAVTIPGLESCFGNEDCSDDKTCQPDLTCK